MFKKQFHPFLLAPFPFLYLLYVNLGQVSSLAANRLILFTELGTVIIYCLLWLLLRNGIRAGLVTDLCIVLWYTWNHVAGLALVLPLLGLTILVWRNQQRFGRAITFFLNAISLSLTGFVVLMIAFTGFRRDLHLGRVHVTAATKAPDVYFIVLDSYGSAKVMKDYFGYDDQPMVNALTKLGFQVGDCTAHATTTSDTLTKKLNGDPTLTYSYDRLIHSKLRTTLEQRGYSTWAFSTGWIWTEFMDADRYIQPAPGPMTEFEAFALTITPLNSLVDLDVARGNMTRLRALTLLTHLPDAASDPTGQFVFAHIIQPHPPFVFGPNGEVLDPSSYENSAWNFDRPIQSQYLPELYAKGYINQVQYLTKALPPALEKIVTTAPDSIIILTGDHGPWYSVDDYEAHSVMCATYGLKALEVFQAVNEIIGK